MRALSIRSPWSMQAKYNLLKYYRKRHHLTLEDVASLLGHKHLSQISRYESGTIGPKIELSLLYLLLFNEPIEAFYIDQKIEMRRKLIVRIKNMLDDISVLQLPGWRYKQKFLSEVLHTLKRQEEDDIKQVQATLLT